MILRGKLDKRRRQKLTQAYSELYWESKLRDIVYTEWTTKCLKDPSTPRGGYLAFMNDRVRELYNAEPGNIQDLVKEYRETSREEDEGQSSSYLLPGEDQLPLQEQERRSKAREMQE